MKAEIEAAGWAVVDQAQSFRLHRAYPADVVEADGRVRHGWSGAVPSRLEAAPRALASVVLIAPGDPDGLERVLADLAGVVSDDIQRVVVANAPGPETETLLTRVVERWAEEAEEAEATRGAMSAGETASARDASHADADAATAEVVWTVQRLGIAAALNAGIRRAAGSVVILLDARMEAVGDFVTPLVVALDDPTVAVAGPWGLVSADVRRFDPVEAGDVGAADVTAVSLAAMAFRRADYAARGPLDERFVEAPLLDAWWSLVLRDPDEHEMTPRRAILVDVPLVRPDAREAPADERIVRRNRYRIIDTFGGRRDLAVPGA